MYMFRQCGLLTIFANSVDTFPVRRYSSRQRKEGIRISSQMGAAACGCVHVNL